MNKLTHSDFQGRLYACNCQQNQENTSNICQQEPWRSTMTLRLCLSAHSTAFSRYGSWPLMYGSPGAVSNAQYPMGSRTWLSLYMLSNSGQYGRKGSGTYPAAAISLKSASVIQVSQWCLRAWVAFSRSWLSQKDHSSTRDGFPVASNREGLSHR